jgi:hypothetical protein
MLTAMRSSWLALVLVGCYSPSPPAGAPCSTTGECPSGLTCGADNTCGGGGTFDGGGSDAGSGGSGSLLVHARVGNQVVTANGTVSEVYTAEVQVYLDDGTQPTLTIGGDDSFTFERETADQGYIIVYGSSQLDGSTPEYHVAFPTFGRTNAVAPTDDTELDITLAHGSDITGGLTTLFATGLRAELDAPDGTDPFTFAVDWEDAYTIVEGDEAGLLDASQGDTLWFLHYNDGSDSYAIDTAANVAETLMDGQTATINAALATPLTQECTHFLADGDGEATRMGANLGVDPDNVDTDYVVASMPAASQTFAATYDLAYGNSDGAGGTTFHYTNPFPNEGELAALDSHVSNIQRKAGMSTVTLDADLFTDAPLVTHSCGPAQPTLSLPIGVGMPSAVHLNDKLLGGDNTQIQQMNGLVEVKIDTTIANVDVYILQLFDVTNGNFNYVQTYYSASSTFEVTDDNFEKNHQFLFYIGTEYGFPNAATGDLTTTGYPLSAYFVPTHTFNVQGL